MENEEIMKIIEDSLILSHEITDFVKNKGLRPTALYLSCLLTAIKTSVVNKDNVESIIEDVKGYYKMMKFFETKEE